MSAAVYHLLVFLVLEAMLGIAFVGRRYTGNPDHRRGLRVSGGLLALRTLQLLGELLDLRLVAPIVAGIEICSVVLVGWFCLAPALSRRVSRLYLFAGLGLTLACTAAFLPMWSDAVAMAPALSYARFWQQSLWHGVSVLVALLSALTLLRSSPERENGHRLFTLSLAALGLGFLALFVGSLRPHEPGVLTEAPVAFALTSLGQLINVTGYALLAAAVYRTGLQDMWAYREELQVISEEALRQTQELSSLVEISRAIGESLDLDAILGPVAESITAALNADRCAILLSEADQFGTIQLAAQYAVLQREQQDSGQVTASVADQPVLDYALKQRRQLLINDAARNNRLQALYRLLGSQDVGPTIVQPLIRQYRLLGLLIVGNDRSKRAFEVRASRLLQSIAVELAAAIENACLHQDLEIQTNQLARLLEVQEDGIRRQQAILESTGDGVIFSDREGRITIVNAAAERILGTHRDRIQGRSFDRLMDHTTLGAKTDWRQIAQSGAAYQTVVELDRRIIHVNAAPVLTEAGDHLGTVAVLRDISKETEAESAKSSFIAAISHELRTPITAIRGYAEALSTGMVGVVSETQAHFLGVIRDNALRMVSLTENLIAASEIEKGFLNLEYEETDLPLLVGDVVLSLKSQIDSRQLDVSLEIDEGLPLLEADPSRMRQVLDNLVSNAIKFTYPGGHISIGAQLLRDEGRRASMHCKIWVADNGIGISREEQAHIWERFYRPASPLAEEASGLGVGLSIVKSLVEAHSGRVWMESTLGEGSVFTVLLPVKRPHHTDQASP